jgi:hypothetical protein
LTHAQPIFPGFNSSGECHENQLRFDRLDYCPELRAFRLVLDAGVFANGESAVREASERQKAALRQKPQRGLLLTLYGKAPGRRHGGRAR